MEINTHSRTSYMKTKTLLNSDTSIIEIEDPRFPTTFLNMDQDIMITLMDQEMPTALILDIITRPPQWSEIEIGMQTLTNEQVVWRLSFNFLINLKTNLNF